MKVYELIDSPEKWTKGVYARNACGFSVEPTNPVATCWCAWGALQRCYGDGVELRQAAEQLQTATGVKALGCGWNDLEETTYDIFIQKCKEADV